MKQLTDEQTEHNERYNRLYNQPILTVNYDNLNSWDVKFFWISSFYDVPLKGLCKVQGKLCSFEGCITDTDVIYKIYKLSSQDKLKWLIKKWKFELCVGTHMSYPRRAQNKYYHMRRPYWFWKHLCNLYYGKKIK